MQMSTTDSSFDHYRISARHDVSRGFVFFYFVICPCSFRTKRHNNLFVCDDDDDDD